MSQISNTTRIMRRCTTSTSLIVWLLSILTIRNSSSSRHLVSSFVLQSQPYSSFATKLHFKQDRVNAIRNKFQTYYQSDSTTSSVTNGKQQLTRPERKALERARKAAQAQQTQGGTKKRKNNKIVQANAKQTKAKSNNGSTKSSSTTTTTYKLHSNAVSELCPRESTAEDVIRAIKRAQKNHDEHDLKTILNFLLGKNDSTSAACDMFYGYRGSLLARLAVAALHMNLSSVAREAMETRRQDHYDTIMPLESSALIRGLLRIHNVTDAMTLLEEELSLPNEETTASELFNNADGNENVNGDSTSSSSTIDEPSKSLYRQRLYHRASALCSIASRHFYQEEPTLALEACQMLKEMGPLVQKMIEEEKEQNRSSSSRQLFEELPWLRILQGASQCESQLRRNGHQEVSSSSSNVVYGVLDAMLHGYPISSESSNAIYECVSNALVRRVVFMKGAVSMDTLPPNVDQRGEAVFIGRSNVGKSSLINMITNRSNLAYVSKTPGKTQQLNYFTVNDKVEIEREFKYGDILSPDQKPDRDCFYLVDVPGFGFAKVPQAVRHEWSTLLKEFLVERETLRVVFHLVDARHGTTSEDERIMTQMSKDVLPVSRSNFKYVVVLTKADKNVKGNKLKGKVSDEVVDQIRHVMHEKAGLPPAIPLVVTSSETKLGRDDMWRYLRLATEKHKR